MYTFNMFGCIWPLWAILQISEQDCLIIFIFFGISLPVPWLVWYYSWSYIIHKQFLNWFSKNAFCHSIYRYHNFNIYFRIIHTKTQDFIHIANRAGRLIKMYFQFWFISKALLHVMILPFIQLLCAVLSVCSLLLCKPTVIWLLNM